ncbi:FadR/GntR family transcriptional regulator [Palleronia sp. LCG004]|uniref:FadR/GntR family transcriptional regulator n=1 Tax=Palleronia sp. LCG004 TaxID=3079304 RepID=UPI0029433769|nr:FadR/GntR family transcriptional regulator [Palleronia sp. LCG004]WOI58157.1 FadR/GntR family transcriptional regulator [Palleronia sp. LCG004]
MDISRDAAAGPARRHLDLRIPTEFASPLPTGAAKRTVEVLGHRIANDAYPPGEVMPTEEELAASLGVSRATIRDAIKVLSGKGLVRTARRYGTRVRPIEEWNFLDGDVVEWHDPAHPRIRRIFAETTELRSAIEPAAAALAALRATPDQLRELSAAARAIHPGHVDIQALFAADCQFHVTLLDMTGNNVMRQMRQIILTMLRVSYEFGVVNPDTEDVSREGHIAVADAIAARDPEAARTAMEAMLDRNRSIAEDYWLKA